MTILLLEDDSILADIIMDFLQESYEVNHAYSSSEALHLAQKNSYDLYIFDINVPGISGSELLAQLRHQNNNTPTIFITAYQDPEILSNAFKIGANDFIKKPFALSELKARIENIKRQFHIDKAILIGEINFLPDLHILKTPSGSILLPIKESQLLCYLIQNKARTISNEELANTLWEYENQPSDENIRTLIKNLRNRIGKEHIISIRGIGYRYE